MADLALESVWHDGIYQLETDDPVQGGADGIDNLQAKQLGDNTRYPKDQHATDVADLTAKYGPMLAQGSTGVAATSTNVSDSVPTPIFGAAAPAVGFMVEYELELISFNPAAPNVWRYAFCYHHETFSPVALVYKTAADGFTIALAGAGGFIGGTALFLCRTGSLPLGSLVGFRLRLHCFLLTQALPGALDALSPREGERSASCSASAAA